MAMIDIEWDSQLDDRTRRRHPYRYKNSTVHGWVTKMRGTITGNERIRSSGIEEMKRAKRDRRRRQKRTAEERHARGGHSSFGGFFSMFRGRHVLRKPRHHESRSRAVIVNDIRYGSRDHKGRRPFMHFPHRTHAPYHGHGTRMQGIMSRDHVRHATGIAMNVAAKEERERERRRRQRQRRKEGHDLRVDARNPRR
ncbi:hypothetical protein EIP91_005920 [Steccherinum ochraceum]|uniref:Uncharacterized protein n=1 Tax=Steccherinum ochraceum TaxID=92696 RepID=A0A4R0RRH8_9APHY|nr:hypothetical protein EIP91_005920 [Steccherinum ochraceum]